MTDEGVTPERIFNLSRGWMQSKVFMTAVNLDIFTILGDGSLTAAQVADRLGTEVARTELLLNVLVAMGFLHKEGALFSNTEGAARLLVKGTDTYQGYVAVQSDLSWNIWGRLEESLRTGRPVGEPVDVSDDPQTVRNFVLSLHTRSLQEAENLARLLDLRGRQRLLDLGGGPGTYAAAFCRANPGLKVCLFDRPDVVAVARKLIAAAGLEGRFAFQGGDFRTDSFGEGYDVVFLSAVLHLQGPTTNQKLLGKIYNCLIPGGELIVQDHIMNEAGTAPAFGAVMSLHMSLSRADGARMYTLNEIQEWLKGAGFRNVEKVEGAYQTATRPDHGLLRAVKPGAPSGAPSSSRYRTR